MGSRYEIDRDRNAPCEVTVEGEEEEEGRGRGEVPMKMIDQKRNYFTFLRMRMGGLGKIGTVQAHSS